MTTTQELPAQEREAKNRGDMIALLRDPRFTMSGGSEFALEIVAALAAQVEPHTVAWRFKERINDEFDSDWILTKYEPADGVRIIAKEPLCAHPPAQQVEPIARAAVPAVPEGWKTVPKEPTREMCFAAADAAREYMEWTGGNSPVVIYRAMFAAAPQAPAVQPKWQPIETAPKNGNTVLLAEGDYVDCGFWHDGSECYGHRGEAGWFSEDDRANLLIASNIHPTHWMPFPAAPQAEARQEQPKQPDSSYSAQPKGEEATAKDAARYRWLRTEHDRMDPLCHLVWKQNGDRRSSEWVNTADLDRSIDAALSSTPAQGEGGRGRDCTRWRCGV